MRILMRRPEFADRCDWSKLKPLVWRQLLMRQAQFADKAEALWGQICEKFGVKSALSRKSALVFPSSE
jgi:hypothetical protein